jgi:hypothetical protein
MEAGVTGYEHPIKVKCTDSYLDVNIQLTPPGAICCVFPKPLKTREKGQLSDPEPI